jgi:SAM-dependent methyltransferase
MKRVIALISGNVRLVAKMLSRVRTRFFPNWWTKLEQYANEMGIERMQAHYGYSEFSKMLRSKIPAGAKVLDLGCQKGTETEMISKTNEVEGVDLFPSFVRRLEARGIKGHVQDFHHLRFVNEFDCVYSNNSLEHSTHPDKVLAGVHSALRPGGTFVCGMPLDGNDLNTKDPAHFYRATKDDVVSLFKGFFPEVSYEVINTRERWNWPNPPARDEMIILVAKSDEAGKTGKA